MTGGLHVFLVVLHVTCASLWLGGAICMAAVTVPAIAREVDRLLAARLTRRIGERFRRIAWSCLLLLVVTGALLLCGRGVVGFYCLDATPWLGGLGWLLQLKLALACGVLVLSGLHDFVLMPRVLALLASDHPDLAQAGRRRRTAAWMLRVCIALSIAALGCGVVMSRCYE